MSARPPLHVESAGAGPPLVLLHGWAMHGGLFAPLVPFLARRRHLHALVARFRAGAHALPWRLLPSDTAIQPLVVGASAAAVALSEALATHGVWVPAIRPPTVPANTARLRISLSAAHSEADVDALLAALHAVAA